ncbi:hypothetical protein ACVWZK_001090 [Bradyrhizobium sp. GM0.4]
MLGSPLAEIALEDSVHDAMPDDVGVRRPRPQQFRRQPIESGVALVADDKPLLGVKHAKALNHVVDRGVQPERLILQLSLRAFELLPGDRKLADDLLEFAGSTCQAAVGEYADQAHPKYR